MLQELMADLWIAWQPIYNLRSGTIWGHEALIRGPKDSLFASPADLFELARNEEVEEPFEEICRRMAFEAAAKSLTQPGMLFVNVNPRFLGLQIAPEQAPWPADHTIIEITEASPLFDDPEALQAQVATWRAQGYRIALDDFGAGFAGQAAVLALKPDVVKVDQRLTSGIDHDHWRQTIVAAMLHMCSDLGIATIAEGIETEAELEELVRLGIVMGQGYLLGRPEGSPKRERLGLISLPPAAETLNEAARQVAATGEPGVAAHYAADHGRRIVAWDETAEAITGRKASEMIGLPCWLSGMDHRDLAGNRLCFEACPLVRAMQQKISQDSLVSLRDADGERRWVTMHTEPVISPEGKVLGAVESFSLVARSGEGAVSLHERRTGHGRDASHHLFWRKEVARWLATWQNDEEFAHMAGRFVNALPFRAAAVWQPVQGAGRYAAIAMKGGNMRGLSTRPILAPSGGLVERVFRERRLMYLPGRTKDGDSGPGVHLSAAIPLMHKGVVQGVLTLGDHEGDRLPVPAIEAIEEIAPLLGALMANQQLLGSLQQSRQVFSWMLETAPIALDYQPFHGNPDMQVPSAAAFRSFRRRWPEVAGIQGGVIIMRAESESRDWLLHDVWGTLEARDLALGERWWPKARTFLLQPDAELPPDGALAADHSLAVPGRSLQQYAMRDGRQDIASLLIDVSADGQVKDETLLAVLEFTGLATVNRWRQRQLLRLARHDPLTGALNRRALEERLENYFKTDPSGPSLFLLLDLDDLKHVNDRFGHQAADDLLREFTAYARQALRPSDEVARIGGDEFVWVLYEAGSSDETRRRLQRIMARSPLGGVGSGVTVGMVELPREAGSYAEAYRLADRRLYMGKRSGKGIIVDGLMPGA
jgi:diguanylate cyclase (GGDEF)-like protein/PAS domain S-box-containing protein